MTIHQQGVSRKEQPSKIFSSSIMGNTEWAILVRSNADISYWLEVTQQHNTWEELTRSESIWTSSPS